MKKLRPLDNIIIRTLQGNLQVVIQRIHPVLTVFPATTVLIHFRIYCSSASKKLYEMDTSD